MKDLCVKLEIITLVIIYYMQKISNTAGLKTICVYKFSFRNYSMSDAFVIFRIKLWHIQLSLSCILGWFNHVHLKSTNDTTGDCFPQNVHKQHLAERWCQRETVQHISAMLPTNCCPLLHMSRAGITEGGMHQMLLKDYEHASFFKTFVLFSPEQN